MSVSPELRALVRERFEGCCGYCGVSELDVGNELEVDHHRPRSRDGDDELENLIYCCTPCNRFKGDYWRAEGEPDDVRLLNPNLDRVEDHVVETVSGRLVGLTARGWFHKVKDSAAFARKLRLFEFSGNDDGGVLMRR